MTNSTLPTANEAWGFFGTSGAFADAEAAWGIAFPAVLAATDGTPEGVRDFLDSRHGRHFADDVHNGVHAGLDLKWIGQLKAADGKIDLFGYRLCVLDQLRRTIRRRDVFASRSLRYADPRKGLLSGAAWEAARPAVCRTVGVSASADEELTRLSTRLDLAYRETADRAPANPALSFETTAGGVDLSVAQLDKIEGSVAKIVKLEHAWRRLDGRNDDGFQVAPFPG